MKIANHANGKAQKSRNCQQCWSRMPFTSNSSKSSQLTALRPGKRNHHV